MRKIGTKQVVPALVAVLCGIFIYTGLTKYGFWDSVKKTPTPAFVPTIVCTLLLVICVVTVVLSLKEDGKAVYHKGEFLVIIAAGLIIAATYLVGMLQALALFVVLWLKLVEKTSWKTTALILLIVMAIVIGVFVLWLGVRFPEGLILETLL